MSSGTADDAGGRRIGERRPGSGHAGSCCEHRAPASRAAGVGGATPTRCEVAAALRKRVLQGKLASAGALAALEDLVALPIERFPHGLLLSRAFALRGNASLHDALYLTLAETLEAPLLTRDRWLAGVPGLTARVELVGEGA